MAERKAKRIIMLAPVNFLRSYSGFQYLADFLYTQGFEIDIFAQVPSSQSSESKKLQYPVYSCYDGFIGKIPKLRHFFFKVKIIKALRFCDAVILNTTSPLGYFKECISLKEQFPEKIFIQYCTELWLQDEVSRYSIKEKQYFLSNANIADLIIDVEPNRAALRKKHFNINKRIEIIPNTLPREIVDKLQAPFDFEKTFGIKESKNQRILLFTGQITKASFLEILDIMANTNKNILLIWFAHGSTETLTEARMRASKIMKGGKIQIHDPIARSDLINVMHKADAGLISYSYSHAKNMNLKFSAPTKLYEYISSGLPIVSYGNPSIKQLVDKYDLGVCSPEDNPEALGKAITQLFERSDFDSLKKHVGTVFINDLCYEESAKVALDVILMKLIT